MSLFSSSTQSLTSSTIQTPLNQTTQSLTSAININNPNQVICLQLTPENYLSWKAQVLPLLRGNSLLKFVDGSFPPPPQYIPPPNQTPETTNQITPNQTLAENPSYQQWFTQDQNFLCLLISSLREDIIPLIIDAQTSRQLWVMLENAYASPSTTRIVNLHLSLQECKQNDDSVSTYLYKAKGIWDQLAAAGRPMAMADFLVILFKGIRPEFHNVMNSIDARATPIDFTTLHSLLLNQEMLHQKVLSHNSSVIPSTTSVVATSVNPTANFVQKSTGSRNGSNSSRPNNRNNYNNKGHNNNGSSNPNNFRRNQGFRGQNDRSTKCQICFRFNHTAATCDQRYNHATPPSANTASFYQSNTPINAWFPNTACHTRNSLSHADLYNGSDTLQVGLQVGDNPPFRTE